MKNISKHFSIMILMIMLVLSSVSVKAYSTVDNFPNSIIVKSGVVLGSDSGKYYYNQIKQSVGHSGPQFRHKWVTGYNQFAFCLNWCKKSPEQDGTSYMLATDGQLSEIDSITIGGIIASTLANENKDTSKTIAKYFSFPVANAIDNPNASVITGSKPSNPTNYLRYYYTSLAIHKVLGDEVTHNVEGDCDQTNGKPFDYSNESKNAINALIAEGANAVEKYAKYATIGDFKVISGLDEGNTVTLYKKGNRYESSLITIQIPEGFSTKDVTSVVSNNLGNGTVEVILVKKLSGNKAQYRIVANSSSISESATSNVTLNLPKATFYKAAKYVTSNSKYQQIIPGILTKIIKSASLNFKLVVAPDRYIFVRKVNENNKPLVGAILKITSLSGVALNNNGETEITWETDGNDFKIDLMDTHDDDVFDITELSAPAGYLTLGSLLEGTGKRDFARFGIHGTDLFISYNPYGDEYVKVEGNLIIIKNVKKPGEPEEPDEPDEPVPTTPDEPEEPDIPEIPDEPEEPVEVDVPKTDFNASTIIPVIGFMTILAGGLYIYISTKKKEN